MKDNKSDKIKLISSMVIFGTIGIIRKNISYSSGIVAFARGVMGVLFLFLIHFMKKEKFCFDGIKKNIFCLCLSGIFLGLDWIFLFEAYRYTAVSTATVCYYMAPVFVILLSWIFLKEKITPKKAVCCFIAFLGMIFVSGILNTGLSGARGIFFALIAAIMYSAVVILNKLIKNISSDLITLIQLGVSAVALLPYVILKGDITNFSCDRMSIILLIVAGIVHTGIAYYLYFGSIKNISAQTVALFGYIDPAVAVILSVVVLKENITLYEWAGVFLIMLAAIISEVTRKELLWIKKRN